MKAKLIQCRCGSLNLREQHNTSARLFPPFSIECEDCFTMVRGDSPQNARDKWNKEMNDE